MKKRIFWIMLLTSTICSAQWRATIETDDTSYSKTFIHLRDAEDYSVDQIEVRSGMKADGTVYDTPSVRLGRIIRTCDLLGIKMEYFIENLFVNASDK